jgi:hypothetical protein
MLGFYFNDILQSSMRHAVSTRRLENALLVFLGKCTVERTDTGFEVQSPPYVGQEAKAMAFRWMTGVLPGQAITIK